LGKPVVPEVYWMLIGSSNDSSASRAATSSIGTPPPCARSQAQSGVPMYTTVARAGQPVRTSSIIAR
jgi:hypothetical protein